MKNIIYPFIATVIATLAILFPNNWLVFIPALLLTLLFHIAFYILIYTSVSLRSAVKNSEGDRRIKALNDLAKFNGLVSSPYETRMHMIRSVVVAILTVFLNMVVFMTLYTSYTFISILYLTAILPPLYYHLVSVMRKINATFD